MPIYEYQCRHCRKRSTVLVLNPLRPAAATCQHCGSPDLDRLLSRFAAPKSEEARLESLADPGSLGGLDENDPHSVARFMKKMGEEMGEDVGDVDAMMEESGNESDTTGSTDSL
jgi:putative FmdB family regulatory protein